MSATALGSHVIKGMSCLTIDRGFHVLHHALTSAVQLAAIARVPRLKADQVDEVFFGNVLSAG